MRRPWRRHGSRAVLAAVVGTAAFALAAAGCGPGASTLPPGPAASPSTVAASASPAAPSAVTSPTTSASPAASAAIAIDPTLLDLLPAQLDGLDRQHDPTIEAGAFSEPTLAGIATAGITALYIDPAAGEFAYVAIVRLRSALSDAQFRAWRDTYDASACSQAGSVAGHAEATIGGHDTFIGTCSGGLLTYHTILSARGLLVSISSVGARRLGELLLQRLPS